MISVWEKDSKGLITVQASTNWKNISATGTSDYIKETCTYYHNSLATGDYGIEKDGRKLTIPISAESLEVENHQNYSFAIIFKVFTGDNEDALLTNLNLSVKIGNDTAQNIILDYGGTTYIVVPCDYYSSVTDVVITNHGSEYVAVPYFAYTLVNRVQETYRYDSGIMAHRLSSTTTSLRSGYYSDVAYDEKQRVATELTREITTDAVAERTEYSYYDASEAPNIAKGKIETISTTKAGSTEIDETKYIYTGSWNDYTETVTTTKGEIKMQSSYNILRANSSCTVTQIDENNLETTEYYETICGDIRLCKVEYGNTREEYGYNNLGQITNINVYEGDSGTPVFSQIDNYDENGVYLGSSYGGTKYTYGYDDTGFVTSIGYGDTAEDAIVTPLMQYLYYEDSWSISSNQLRRKFYMNGNVEEYTYSKVLNGNKAQVDYRNTESGSIAGSYVYNYNSNGTMISQSYIANGSTQVSYDYGEIDNLEQQTISISGLEFKFQYTNHYDTLSNRVNRAQIYSFIGCQTTDTKTTNYNYDTQGRMSELACGSYDVEYAYDKMGRLTNRLVSMPYGYQDIQNENYVYKTYGNGYTTNLLTYIEDQTNAANDRSATYDENGYVTSVTYNENTYTYTYDGVGRLASETIGDTTKTYTYDSQNNVQKAGLTYTNGKLTAVNGAQIVYDAMGNPTKYKGNTFTWEQGRKHVSGSMNGKSFSYAYDGNGMRYEKKVNGVRTCYYYNGDQLLMESKNGKRTYYIYGVTGVEGMIVEENHQENVYYFDKNTLGDIIAIRNQNGNIVAMYKYDAWGNITYQYGSVAELNPFRYRGYYYDTETGFYYLQTRYYDPTICRFINADNYELVATLSSVPGQLNMYAYCNNNPIIYTDETGESFLLTAIIVGAIIGAAIGGTVAGISAAQNGEDALGVTLAVFEGIFVGGVIGGAAGALVGVAPTIGASLSTMMSGTAGAGVMAMSAEAYLVAAGATAVLGNVMFSSSGRPRRNTVQNEQMRAALRENGLNPNEPRIKDFVNRLESEIRRKGLDLNYQKLVEFIKGKLGR
ncbi:MAG: RHS repeat-associated core domain-containing protein [Clostridia bacterium]|nr:RHS repeat-associated core domain-containing protein [Clostridia bacterium]